MVKVVVTTLLAAAMLFGQSSITCPMTEVSSYSSEVTYNGGGKSFCRINNSNYYHTLVRIDLAGATLRMPCTLFVEQKSFTSGSTTYDWTEYATEISTVTGTWTNGTASSDAQTGSVCWRYRAYRSSPTPADYWLSSNTSSTLDNVSRSQNETYINETGLTVKTEASGEPCFAVLDYDALVGLASGRCGGLRISRAPGNTTGQMRFKITSGQLRWDPAGTVITAVENGAVSVENASVSVKPNPANPTTTISFNGMNGVKKVHVLTSTGRIVNTIETSGSSVVWDGKDANGNSLSSGVYLCRVDNNGKSHVVKMMLNR